MEIAGTDVLLDPAAYQPHVPVSPEADAAVDRLVASCGGRTEESAARVCVLIQAHAATLALGGTRAQGRRWRCTWPPQGTRWGCLVVIMCTPGSELAALRALCWAEVLPPAA